jgi:hypothetical protein
METTFEDEMEIESYELCIRILESQKRKIMVRGRLTEKETSHLGEIDMEIHVYENILDRFHKRLEKKLIKDQAHHSCTYQNAK